MGEVSTSADADFTAALGEFLGPFSWGDGEDSVTLSAEIGELSICSSFSDEIASPRD